ncbi:MAG: WecB/TagA/CpsF family glycosyltransferase [Cyanobacteria bacterium P01_A01_bin.105]
MTLLADSNPLEQLDVLGFPVHQATDYPGWLLAQARRGRGAHVVTINAEMCIQGERDPALQQVLQNADLVIPDGSGIELYFRWLEGIQVKRYPGIEFAADVLAQLSPTEPVVFYGGAPGVADKAADHWRSQLPSLNIALVQHGYLSEADQPDFQARLQALQPTAIFVGLGVPRQELWIQSHRPLVPQAAWIGVGGSFDIWGGVKERAPRWFCDNHLEWLYRLYQEPWRWRRMLALPKFVGRALMYQWQR